MPNARTGAAAFVACSVAIFWPGAFIFGFPGVLGPYWQQALEVGRAEVGKSLFFVLAGAGSFMYLSGRWQEGSGVRMYRVRIGAFKDRREADRVRQKLERVEQFKPWVTTR